MEDKPNLIELITLYLEDFFKPPWRVKVESPQAFDIIWYSKSSGWRIANIMLLQDPPHIGKVGEDVIDRIVINSTVPGPHLDDDNFDQLLDVNINKPDAMGKFEDALHVIKNELLDAHKKELVEYGLDIEDSV